MKLSRNAAVLFLLLSSLNAARSAELSATALSWLQRQTNVQTWTAELTQTRTIKALTQPLQSKGRVWFAAPDLFRWELGDPPSTIAIRKGGQMLILYPRLNRAERYPLANDTPGPWKETLALLEAGFARNQTDLETRFLITSESTIPGGFELNLQPRSRAARRLIPQIKVHVATNDFSLLESELTFADGSTMRNQFTRSLLNPPLQDDLFAPPLPPHYEVVEPFSR